MEKAPAREIYDCRSSEAATIGEERNISVEVLRSLTSRGSEPGSGRRGTSAARAGGAGGETALATLLKRRLGAIQQADGNAAGGQSSLPIEEFDVHPLDEEEPPAPREAEPAEQLAGCQRPVEVQDAGARRASRGGRTTVVEIIDEPAIRLQARRLPTPRPDRSQPVADVVTARGQRAWRKST